MMLSVKFTNKIDFLPNMINFNGFNGYSIRGYIDRGQFVINFSS